jgi:GR25 family glycosyltransferase involved in LPS biosynthesis
MKMVEGVSEIASQLGVTEDQLKGKTMMEKLLVLCDAAGISMAQQADTPQAPAEPAAEPPICGGVGGSLTATASQLEARTGRIEGKQERAAPHHTQSCSSETEATAALACFGLRKFLVISLERTSERVATLRNQTVDQGLHLEVLTASDGRDVRFRSYIFPSRHPEATCSNIVGAMFESHRRAWEEAASTPGHTVVFEDDVHLAPDFAVELARRFPGLPASYDIAFLGTTTQKSSVYGFSGYLLRPDVRNQPKQSLSILGMYAYIVSQSGAARLLELHKNTQRHCLFTAIDLWIGQHLSEISVFIFETPPSLAEYIRTTPSPTIKENRQLGLVVHVGSTQSHVPDRNALEGETEFAMIKAWEDKGRDHFAANRFREGLGVLDAALGSMRRYSCWSAANVLQNTGVMLLRLMVADMDTKNAWKTLSQSREAFSSALRYYGGNLTQVGGYSERDFHNWIANAHNIRKKNGLKPIPPHFERSGEVTLVDGSKLWPEQLLLIEPAQM